MVIPMRIRGRGWGILKICILSFTCLLLVYTVQNVYFTHGSGGWGGRRFGLPGGLSLANWSASLYGEQSDHALPKNKTSVQNTTIAANKTGGGGGGGGGRLTLSPAESSLLAPLPIPTYAVPDRPAVPSDQPLPYVGEQHPTIGKVTILFGEENIVYERAVRTHNVHNRIHGYPMNILRQDILNNVWSKPAYILSLLLRELAKPPGERLEWLLWFDADTVIMNPNIPIELFLPPSPDFDHVHLLVTHDWNGLNNGVFPVRVHPWSVELFAAVLSFPNYSPSYELVFRDQSALEQVLKMPKFGRGRTLKLPQRWFNAYQGKDLKETSEPFEMRRGDLLVHFAGVGERMKRMAMWMERAEQRLPEWEIDLKYSSYPSEVREFWDEKRVEMKALKATVIENSNVAKTLIEHSESELNVGGDRMEDKERKIAEDRVRGLEQVLKTESKKEAWAVDLEGITIATAQLSDATAPLRDILSKIRKETLKDAYTAIFDATQCLIGITSHNSNSDSNTIHHEQQIEEIEDKIERLREKLQSTQEDNLDVKGVTGEVLDLVKAYKDLEIVVQRERFQEAAISAAHIAISGSQGGGNTDEGNGDDGESGGGSESQNGSEDCGGDDQDQDESNHDEENATNNDGSTDDLPSHSSPPLSEKGHPRRSK